MILFIAQNMKEEKEKKIEKEERKRRRRKSRGEDKYGETGGGWEGEMIFQKKKKNQHSTEKEEKRWNRGENKEENKNISLEYIHYKDIIKL